MTDILTSSLVPNTTMDSNAAAAASPSRGGGAKKKLLASSYLRKLIIAPNHDTATTKPKPFTLTQSSPPPTSDLLPPSTSSNSNSNSNFNSNSSSSSSSASSSSSHPDVEHLQTRLITHIFSSLSSLKDAYSRLQSAHLLSHPDKLHSADQAVVAQLKRMSDLKHSYIADMEKLANSASAAPAPAKPAHSHSDGARPAPPQTTTDDMILKSYEGLISNFHSELAEKNALVDSLKDMLAKTTLQKEKLEKKMKKLQQHRRMSDVGLLQRQPAAAADGESSLPSPQMLETMVLEASEAVTSFTELLVSFMKMADWNVEAAAKSIEPDLAFARKSHVKYAFEAYVTRRMLSGFESESFCVDSSLPWAMDVEARRQDFFKDFQFMRNEDPLKLLTNTTAAPNHSSSSFFANYCLKKFVEVVHPKMEEAFFGNLQAHREQISQGKHPTTQFYHCFLQLAKSMWLLHSLAFSFHPAPARIFQAHRDAQFSPQHMESVIPRSATPEAPRVGFTVMPGFHVTTTIIKCQVYPWVAPPPPQAEANAG